MENPDDDSNLDNYTKNRVQKGIGELLEEKELKIKWRKEIEENESIQNYLLSFEVNSVKSFVDHYLNQKFAAHKYGDFYKTNTEQKRTKWIDMAHRHLGAILQKKLFDVQCLWRAEKIEIPEIEIAYDFEVIGENIFNCRLIEPITESEIELYQHYLLSDYFEYHDYAFPFYDWQDYDQIKEAISDNLELDCSSWYDFSNLRSGNGSLLLLPNIRGEKEDFYFKLCNEEWRAKRPEVYNRPANNELIKPIATYHDQTFITNFVETFEDIDSRKKYKYYNEGFLSSKSDIFEYDELMANLMSIDEPVPIEANADFKIALEKCYAQFCSKKIAEHLPLAHEQYLFNLAMGFEVSVGKCIHSKDLSDKYKADILEGRKLNGEPENLNF